MGQTPPGGAPEVFAPGIVSTDSVELNAVFSPDGKLFYFTRKDAGGLYSIWEMKEVDGRWTQPQIASFSGLYEDADPFITTDGKYLFYISKRPDEGSGPPHDILILEKAASGWSEPHNPGPPLNTEHNEIYPWLSATGVLYFKSDRPGGLGQRDIYVSRWEKGSFSEPVNVGGPISSAHNEGDIFVAPDESYVVFVSSDRPDGYGSGDL